ncbi:MAG: 50S ribosomal protein L10 [Candidatus Pacebacteria bacterium]|nr:50S ribosomal protein L10 [Candidatus Paceibacterota bacterium]
MAITKQKKTEIIDKLKDAASSESAVFVSFRGVPVSDTVSMRSKLRENGVSYFVAKKTLIKKAFAEAGIDGEVPVLDGEVAVAYSTDATAPAREVFDFHKKLGDKLRIVGGVFENKFQSRSEMEVIAQIPSLHVLRGMFVNVINSPIQGFAMVVKAYADKKS